MSFTPDVAFEGCFQQRWMGLNRDDPFSDAQWRAHQSWRRYLPHPWSLGMAALRLSPIWGWAVAVAAAVGLYATYAEPAGAPTITGHGSDLIIPFNLATFALSLLMMFRTNSSYARWWEARGLWGQACGLSANFLRLVLAYVPQGSPELVPPLVRWTCALVPSKAAYLRRRSQYLRDHLTGVLQPGELEWLCARDVPALAVSQVLSNLLRRASGLSDIERMQMQDMLTAWGSALGQSEKLLYQPIPTAYSRMTLRFLVVFITFLPLPFWDFFSWWAVPISGTLAFLLAGVENIGTLLEEPHRVLPLNRIAAAILGLLRKLMEEEAGAADVAATACCCLAANGSAKAGSAWGGGGEGGGGTAAAGDGVQPMGGWAAAAAAP